MYERESEPEALESEVLELKDKDKSNFRVVAMIQKQVGGHWQDMRPVRKLGGGKDTRAEAEDFLSTVVKAFPHPAPESR